MTLPFLTEAFWRHCVLGRGAQRRALPRDQSEELKILNILFPQVGIKLTTCLSHIQSYVNK